MHHSKLQTSKDVKKTLKNLMAYKTVFKLCYRKRIKQLITFLSKKFESKQNYFLSFFFNRFLRFNFCRLFNPSLTCNSTIDFQLYLVVNAKAKLSHAICFFSHWDYCKKTQFSVIGINIAYLESS